MNKKISWLTSVFMGSGLLLQTGAVTASAQPLDLNNLTWSDLPPAQNNASYRVDTGLSQQAGYNLDKRIQAGNVFTEIFTLGDFAETGIADLSPQQIAALSNVNLKEVALSEFTHFTMQSLGSLMEAIPELADLPLGEVKPLADLVQTQLEGYATEQLEAFLTQKISRLLQDPTIAQLPLADIPNLQGLAMDTIPGLAATPLKQFAGWKGITLKNIPGVDQIPLADLGILSPSAIATLDLVWGAQEANATFQPISGGINVGFQYPCRQENCAYIELSSNGHLGDRWIKGGAPEEGGQMVPGGSGLLGKAFGGEEPTGRMLGSEFKLILMNTDEATATAEFGLATRFCQRGWVDLGCTPFIFGPWSILQASEGDSIFLGYGETLSGKDIQTTIPPQIQAKIDAAKQKYSDQAPTDQGDCLKKVIQAVPLEQRVKAESTVPRILSEAEKLKLTDSQTAYAIAYLLAQPNQSIAAIAPQLKQYITSTKADFFGLGQALNQAETEAVAIANRASNYQAILKKCFFGGSCGGGKMQRPSTGVVTSEMGQRLHPIYGTWKLHAGIDVSAGMGKPILAADCGKAFYVGWESGYGNVVVLDHGNNLFTRYAHMSSQSISKNQVVKKGQLIGYEGSTGGSTGAHLHFEVRQGGRFGTAQNPRKYVNF